MERLLWFYVLGCFSYDSKGPCHIWDTETVAQKKVADAELSRLNEKIEPEYQGQWEVTNGMRRLRVDR